MILATFVGTGGKPALGAIDRAAGSICDLQARQVATSGKEHPALVSMLALIDGGDAALELARRLAGANHAPTTSKLADVRLLAPLPVPQQVREFSVFEQHVRDAPRRSARIRAKLTGKPAPDAPPPADIPEAFRKAPVYYMMNRFNVIGPDAAVEWPRYSEGYFDYELEIGMVLGHGGKNIPRAEADSHIFGYTIFNDFSARQQQWRDMAVNFGPTKGKSFDTGTALGPWIVTRDEMPDILGHAVSIRVNGEEWTHATIEGMLHSFVDMIAYVSQDETLHAGEIFASGTVGGCSGMEIDRWLKVGDTIELQVDGIGTLRNRIVMAPGTRWDGR
jgi:2-keto-4-pentenoate hydratase/2-oxohepta-3-ene-1,7-dioic acid hydratase in catechol pathway